MIEFSCRCGKKLKIDDKYAGKEGKCPHCKEVVQIPQSSKNFDVDNFVNDLSKEPPRDSKVSNTIDTLAREQSISNEKQPTKLKELTRDCPYCGEEIIASALKCKHCGEFINGNISVMNNRLPIEQNIPRMQNAYTPTIVGANSLHCPSCGSVISNIAKTCPACGMELRSSESNTGLIIAGWIGVCIFTPLGFIIGIILCCKQQVGHGVLMIIMSVISAIIGLSLMAI